MNQSYSRDVKYSFLKRCVRPINSLLIDEEWMKEKNIEMEIIIPYKSFEGLDEEFGKNPVDFNKWNDLGMEELLGMNLHTSDIIHK